VTTPFVRTVLGDITTVEGVIYAHEHLIIDSPLIADRFPHIHLHDVDAAVEEVAETRRAGAGLMVDTMPVAAGRDVSRLAVIAERTGVHIVAVTGLHHDRYYGPLHWTNRVSGNELTGLFIADLTEGIDAFDYTGPVVRRTPHRAGVVKVATSGAQPDSRDVRNLNAVAAASVATGAPVMTHCEGGLGGVAQVAHLAGAGVPPSSIIVSHVDKAPDISSMIELARWGSILELDQSLREWEKGTGSVTVRAILALVEAGFEDQIVLGTDGARRTLWRSLGGRPGLAWLASDFPAVLGRAGLGPGTLHKIFSTNAMRALTWREAS